MNGHVMSNGLKTWKYDNGGVIDPAMLARMQAHPRFTAAVRALARNMLDAGENDRALDGIFKDAGRYGVTFIAMYLHLTGGLTLPRLKALTIGSNLSSPGRARAVLLYLRYLGFIVRDTRHPGETQRYVPTESCLAAWRGHLAAALDAAAVIEPDARRVHRTLHVPDVFTAFGRRHSEHLVASFALTETFELPFVRIFMHRNAGTQILWAMILDDASGVFPPLRTHLSVPGLARRFGVSRMHVRRMIDAATQAVIVSQDGDVLLFSEDTRQFMAYLYATQLVWLLSAAAHALDQFPELAAA